VPLLAGLLLGWNALAGLIMGAIVAGVPRALLMANAGGAWDNAKKYIELQGLKKTDIHKAAVVGDAFGDLFVVVSFSKCGWRVSWTYLDAV
jgi:K(+)-stimulated pyrophosphate-energized sodium pump